MESLISYLFTNVAVNPLPMFSILAVAWRQHLGLILVLLNCCQVAEPVDFKFSTAGSRIYYTSHLHSIGPLVEYAWEDVTPEII